MAMNIENLYDNLTASQIKALKAQIARFQEASLSERKTVLPVDKVMLPEGTLIHGTGANKDTLSSIADSGIITGQAFGIAEDGETFHCADFHRVNKTQSLEEYNENFKYTDGRCPFGKRGKFTIALVLYPEEALDKLTVYDCYKSGTPESDMTKSFVNMKGLPVDDGSIVSSVLFGVPSNFINGIIVGDNSIKEDMIFFLINKFPGAFISRNNGEVIYRDGDQPELVSSRIQSLQRQTALEQKEEELRRKDGQMDVQRNEMNKLWSAIATLPVEQIAQIYEQIGYQSDFMESAERLKEQHSKKAGDTTPKL